MTVRRAVAPCLIALCSLPLVAPGATAATPSPGPRGPAGGSAGHSLCAPPADTVAPVVTRVSFGRGALDLDTGTLRQTVRVSAADTSGHGTASGIARVSVSIRGNRYYDDVRPALASGTRADGVWIGHFTVSEYAHPGTYRIDELTVTDRAGNAQTYPGYSTVPDSPSALGLHPSDNPTFAVTGTPAPPPARQPAGTLRSFDLGSSRVDTTTSVRRVRVTAQFTGAPPRRIYVEFISVRQPKTRPVFLRAVLHRQVGGWSGALRVPRWLGRQVVQPYLVADFGSGFRPATRSYSPFTLAHRHFPATLSVVSGVDTTDPALHSVTFSPSAIDSTTGAQRVTVTAQAADTGSGVRAIEVSGGIRHGVNGVAESTAAYPLAAAGIGYLSSDDFTVRLRKTATGEWSGTTTVRQCVPSGTYRLTANLVDVAGNYRYYSTRQLAARHITSRVSVTSKHGDVAAPYVYSEATFAARNQLFLNFSEGVANVNTTTLSVYPLSPRDSRFTSPATVSQLECDHGKTTVACSGANGLVTAVALTVPDLTPGVIYDVYANQDRSAPQLVDVNGNPMDWNSRAAEVRAS